MSDLKYGDVDKIHQNMLDNISDTYQKTQGFPVWDLLRAVALGLKRLWDKLFLIEYKQDIDNLEGAELDKIIYQRTGLKRRNAVKAVGNVTIVNGNSFIAVGDLFETENGVQFKAVENKPVFDGETVAVEAVEAGIAGNVPAGCITQMPVTLPNISKITNAEPMSGGYDAESDDDYRQRYYEYLQIPATAGNKYHYVKWAKEVDGVKAVKVVPCWNGKNTVKVYVVGNDYKPASESLIEAVQEHIDPNQSGEGLGTAPIGAVCTVVSAEQLDIAVNVKVVTLESVDIDAVKLNIRNYIDDYIHSIVYQQDYVSYAKIGACILSVTGVLDYSDLLVNGKQANVVIDFAECPVLGEVSVDV